jgi:hypothetical protein
MTGWRWLGLAALATALIALLLSLVVAVGTSPADELVLFALRFGTLAGVVALAAFLADRGVGGRGHD